LKLLAVINGDYGQRHVDNIRKHGPSGWSMEVWQAPRVLPQVIDYPEEYLPKFLPPADLVLSFGEHKGVARPALSSQAWITKLPCREDWPVSCVAGWNASASFV
jgi:hypothetical protein